MSSRVNLTFAHTWQAEVLPARPLILPQRQYVYPALVEEVENGALEIMVRPADATPFLATCALGFAGDAVPSGVWACPHADWMCAVAGGYAYLVDTREPAAWEQVLYRPVTAIHAVADQNLLLFSSFHSLLAWGPQGRVWQTGRLSWDGIRIEVIAGDKLRGFGWDLKTDQEMPFEVNLKTGEHLGGGYLV